MKRGKGTKSMAQTFAIMHVLALCNLQLIKEKLYIYVHFSVHECVHLEKVHIHVKYINNWWNIYFCILFYLI